MSKFVLFLLVSIAGIFFFVKDLINGNFSYRNLFWLTIIVFCTISMFFSLRKKHFGKRKKTKNTLIAEE